MYFEFPCEADILPEVLERGVDWWSGKLVNLSFVTRGSYYRVVLRTDEDFEPELLEMMTKRYQRNGARSTDGSDYWYVKVNGQERPY